EGDSIKGNIEAYLAGKLAELDEIPAGLHGH
ncbi:MAG: dinitrogenase iron-molybdenum cofactor biosynthesis protein, partial [Clostridiaceae bacterium]|nr:dinitrogenase iron-molybdenum cofactor biosynthesis protein [Clostridiaceae bacterium]